MDITPSGQTRPDALTHRLEGRTATHNAVGDCTADEPRNMRRIQTMATLDYPRPVA
jgi:hypothetical protein